MTGSNADNEDLKRELRALKARYEGESTAKEVAGKHIGKYGLAYITIIVIIGVGASLYLDEAKIAAVIGLVSAALTALISMLSGISEAESESQEAAEMQIIRMLIDKLDRDPMQVDVDGDRVTVVKGETALTTKKQPDG